MVPVIPILCGRISTQVSLNFGGLLRNSSAIPQGRQQHENPGQIPRSSEPPCQFMRTWSRKFPGLRELSTPAAKLHCRSGDQGLDEQIKKWISWDRNPETLSKIKELVKAQDWNMLRSVLCSRLDFGADGLTAEMAAGFNALNDLVVLQTAQGLCAYLMKQYPDKLMHSSRGIVIGYDARRNSKRFADLTATVFLNNNFRVYLFQRFVPTPFVPYTILRLNCLAGVMVTASHNPKQENGYKVYWTNGAQITTSHENGIYQAILENLEPKECSWNVDTLQDNKLLFDPYKNVVPAYFESLKREFPCQLLVDNCECPVTYTYTAMHGVGYAYIDMAFPKLNLEEVIPVAEQVEPDPEFPTAPSPDPEEGKSALKMCLETATSNESDIILANDPDADRLAVGELADEGEYKLFTGNELGTLLGWWALELYRMNTEKPDLAKCSMISSTVSSKILKTMAAIEGFTFHETMTGFKWIANKVIDEQKAGKKVLFAFEESIGYMMSSSVPEKDGISAAVHVGTMASYLRCKKCMSLQEKLRDLYEKYGFHSSVVSYATCNDVCLIQSIFHRLRNFGGGQKDTYPKSILCGEFEIEHVRDLTTGYDSSKPGKKAVYSVSEGTQMITFTFKNGFEITLRTSGTEPKLKYYAEMCGKPEDKRWDELEKTTRRMVEAAVNEFYEPEKNCLKLNAED